MQSGRAKVSLLLVTLCGSGLLACGSEGGEVTGNGGSGADTGAGSTSGAPGAGGVNAAGGASGDGGAPGGVTYLDNPSVLLPARAGGVSLIREGSSYVIAAAGFRNTACTVESSMGACEIRRCDEVPSLDAGPVTFSFSALPPATVTLAESYVNYFFDHSVEAGEQVSVSAPGGADVPAFEVSLTTIEGPVLTSPARGENGYVVDASADLVLTWTGAEGMHVVASDTPFSGTESGSFSLTCTFDGSAGTGTIPQQYVGEIIRMSVESVRAHLVQVGDFQVKVTSTGRIRGADGLGVVFELE